MPSKKTFQNVNVNFFLEFDAMNEKTVLETCKKNKLSRFAINQKR